jgi:hypothetical protein
LEPIYLKLYHQTSIQQKIGFDDYWKMFEIQWQERAVAAGWILDIDCRNGSGPSASELEAGILPANAELGMFLAAVTCREE